MGSQSVKDLHRMAVEEFGRRTAAIGPDAWAGPTPCAEWTVHDLVAHVVEENLWAEPLLSGLTIEEVGDRLDGDLLGDDPLVAWAASEAAATAAVAGVDPARIVHLSFGDLAAEEYLWQLTADATVHAWDLAVAIDADRALGDELVGACVAWFASAEELYREAGVVSERVRDPVPGDSPQSALLLRFGRDPDR